MWRNAKRLESRNSGGRTLLRRKLAGAVHVLPLDFQISIGFFADFLCQARVRDGLAFFSNIAAEGESAQKFFKSSARLNEICMLQPANVRRIPVPDEQRGALRQPALILPAKTRSIRIGQSDLTVRTLEPLRDSAAIVRSGDRFLLAEPGVFSTARISELPQRRRSMDIRNLTDSERLSFRHEAEVLKHIPTGRVEILAVFRNIPIQLISRLRFLESRKEILFSIAQNFERRQISVHDLAVIRDRADGEVHMIAHRTRSRPVSLYRSQSRPIHLRQGPDERIARK